MSSKYVNRDTGDNVLTGASRQAHRRERGVQVTLVVPGGRGAQHEAAPVGLPLYGTVGVWCVVLPAWSGAARSLLRRVRFDSQWPRLVTQGQVRRPWSSL